jgi:hypothetical protein
MSVEYNGKTYKAGDKLKLQKLGIKGIKDIKGLDKLVSLKTLDLDNNSITEINGLDNLKNLEVLSLQNNNIKEVQGLENLVNLKKIYLYGNPVYNWVVNTFGKNYKNDAQILVKFYYEKKDVAIKDEDKKVTVKDSYKKVIEKDSDKKIKQLIKVAERIKLEIKRKISEAEDKLKLQKFRIKNIKDLEGLDKLLSLKNLDLDGNLITEINGLDNLKNLEVLSLQHNSIKEIQGLEHLVNLQKIYLYGNPVYDWVINKFGKSYKNDAQILVEYCSNKQKIKTDGIIEKEPIEEIQMAEDVKIKESRLDEDLYNQDTELIKKVLKFEYENQRRMLKAEMVNELGFTMDDVEKYFEIIDQKISCSKAEKQELRNYTETVIKQFPTPSLYDLIITLKLNYKKARKIGQFLVKEGWLKFLPDFPLKEEKLVEKDSIDKVKQMVKVSDRIRLDMMRKALKLDEEIFVEKIFEWAEKFDFRIDADMLIVNNEKMGDFYNALEEEVAVFRDKKVCLVCKGEPSGFNVFICPECDSIYCDKCARALSEIENICWVCESPLDQSKPVQKEERGVEEIKIKEEIKKK